MLNNKELQELNKTVDTKKSDRAAIIFNALSDPNRCKIFRIFLKKGKEGLYVSDVARLLKLSPSAASQHLKILVITGLVGRRREGQKVNYFALRDDVLVDAIARVIIKNQ